MTLSVLASFTGDVCSTDINECDTMKDCDKEGTEKCVDEVHNYKCICKAGFTGPLCKVGTHMLIFQV